MKLELTRRGDYAVRAMLALAEAGNSRLSAAVVGERMRIPASFVPQVMADLSRAGMAHAALGRHGGYRLARSARTISLLEVVEAAEGDPARRTCVLRGSPCAEDATCQVHDAFSAAQHAMRDVLDRTTLHDVARAGADSSADAQVRPA
jgi:Rrf2 family protein